MSIFAAGACVGALAPPGDPPPPGGPPPGFPPPPGGWEGGGYFFIALPKAFITHSSLVGAAFVKAIISVGAMVVLIFGRSRIRVCRGGSIAFGANGLSLIL